MKNEVIDRAQLKLYKEMDGNIICLDLVDSKKMLNLALPNFLYDSVKSSDFIVNPVNKAGLLSGIFSSQNRWEFGDLRKSLASFVIYIQQVFRPMPNSSKNLIADTTGVSASTQELAKLAQSVLSLSDEDLSNRLFSLSKEEQQPLLPLFRAFLTAIASIEKKKS